MEGSVYVVFKVSFWFCAVAAGCISLFMLFSAVMSQVEQPWGFSQDLIATVLMGAFGLCCGGLSYALGWLAITLD
ncbi:hypothetical protein [Curtobacterium sp. MCBD17_040]|uniref:hypothetical protein n=1 Tax=Curtobacterium sp. MCBD17_040 TaxID=2175674 RepID=UPI000DA990C9|nr:hypothetical protein [Curtobacterium sp. MCBD17_040]WIB65864.1 hypothetical protein DEI94_17265 [Curtobacterium sp. MCBD17_040]